MFYNEYFLSKSSPNCNSSLQYETTDGRSTTFSDGSTVTPDFHGLHLVIIRRTLFVNSDSGALRLSIFSFEKVTSRLTLTLLPVFLLRIAL